MSQITDTITTGGSVAGVEILHQLPTVGEFETILKYVLQISILIIYLVNYYNNGKSKKRKSEKSLKINDKFNS